MTITQNQYNAGTAAKSDVITAQAQLLNAQAAFIAAGAIARPPAIAPLPRARWFLGLAEYQVYIV